MNLDVLKKYLADRKEPKFRFNQIKRAFYQELLAAWEGVTVLPAAFRQTVQESVPWDALSVVKEQTVADTEKILAAGEDDSRIETVLMRHGDDRRTVCVSSQVGCPMACGFCATGQLGLKRNLTRDEIAEQVILFARRLKLEGSRVTNAVVMGMGEPLNNYDAVLAALRLLNDPEAFGLGARQLSLSTCGIVPGILRLAEEPLQLNLAISLHAARDELRSRLMPVNRTYPLAVLMKAVREYLAKTNRRVMFEYLMLRGVNDREQDARDLAQLLGPDFRLVQVNLLTYHPTQTFTASNRTQAEEFLRTLHELGVPATHRKSFGEEIDAACGQLAAGTRTTQHAPRNI